MAAAPMASLCITNGVFVQATVDGVGLAGESCKGVAAATTGPNAFITQESRDGVAVT